MGKVSKFFRGVKQFIVTSGFTKLFYFLVFLLFLAMGYKMLSGVFLGIFIYINYEVIQEVIQGQLNKI